MFSLLLVTSRWILLSKASWFCSSLDSRSILVKDSLKQLVTIRCTASWTDSKTLSWMMLKKSAKDSCRSRLGSLLDSEDIILSFWRSSPAFSRVSFLLEQITGVNRNPTLLEEESLSRDELDFLWRFGVFLGESLELRISDRLRDLWPPDDVTDLPLQRWQLSLAV